MKFFTSQQYVAFAVRITTLHTVFPAGARWVLIAALFLVPTALEADPSDPIHLSVDLTDAPRRIFHVREEIPVSAGELTLYFVK